MQAVTYHRLDDPDLTMEKIFATLPDQFVMMKQIVLSYALSAPTDCSLNQVHVLQVAEGW